MSPPPVPWFRGRTISVTEDNGNVAIHALPGHTFTEPRGTHALYLPIDTMVIALAEGASLAFHGDFTRVGRPNDVMLAPVDPDDAQKAIAEIGKRLELPRRPRVRTVAELLQATDVQLVTVEAENFDGIELDRAFDSGQRLRIMGFYYPTPHPRLHVLSLTPLN